MNRVFTRIYELVDRIPSGQVTTYGQLAAMCGLTDARLVGEAMNASSGIPWQRVINSRGSVSIGGATGQRQRELLEKEGVVFDEGGYVDLEKFGWTPDGAWLAARGYRIPPKLIAANKQGQKQDQEGKQPKLF